MALARDWLTVARLNATETGSPSSGKAATGWRLDLATDGTADAAAVAVAARCGEDPPVIEGDLVETWSAAVQIDTDEPGRPPAAGSALYLVAFAVPDADVTALEEWYAAEHVPQMMAVPGWRRIQCARVVRTDGRPFTHLALHWIDEPATLETEARKAASPGPLRDRVADRPWFGAGLRLVGRPILQK